MASDDLYSILGVPPDISAEDLKRAFQSLALKHHPDKSGDVEIFSRIREAYEALSSPRRRQEYDRKRQWQEDQTIFAVSDEVALSEMAFDDAEQMHFYECRCGGDYVLTQEERAQGVNIVGCTNCGLHVKVNF